MKILEVIPVLFKGKEPKRGSKGAAGWDIYAAADVTLKPLVPTPVPTGLSLALPEGYYYSLVPRSGLALDGITIVNSPGTIDEDFRGEIKVIMLSYMREYFISKGRRIAQLILLEYKTPFFNETDVLPGTDRGNNGFGSTGV